MRRKNICDRRASGTVATDNEIGEEFGSGDRFDISMLCGKSRI